MPIPPDPKPASGQFTGGEHRFPVRVYFEDTDAGGVVYHANYLRYMERARSDMLRVAGIDQRRALEDGTGVYAISDIALRYLRPARLDDDLVVRSTVSAVRAAACIMQQSIWRGQDHIAEGSVTAAFISPSGRPRRQPQAWLSIFTRIAAGDSRIP